MLHFKNLNNSSVDLLLDVFNASFADYLVPLQLNREQLERKLAGDSVDLELSVGAFSEGELVGFILHGVNIYKGKLAVYNAGTGVRPAFRGQGATAAMYQFILPELEARGITTAVLEVIDKNIPAIKSYETVGYKVQRELLCFRGFPKHKVYSDAATVRLIDNPDWDLLQTFRDWEPSWQNAVPALRNLGSAHATIGIFDQSRLIAYANYNPQNNRIAQFAVDTSYRGKGLAAQLFQYICKEPDSSCTLINIDAGAEQTIGFLQAMGLQSFVTQYEMTMNL